MTAGNVGLLKRAMASRFHGVRFRCLTRVTLVVTNALPYEEIEDMRVLFDKNRRVKCEMLVLIISRATPVPISGNRLQTV